MVCGSCQQNFDISLSLSDKVQVMQEKLDCLIQIKSELTLQLTERNHQLQLLESENIDLRNILKLKQTKTFISNILKRPKISNSMPDNLNTVDKKRMKGISLMRAFSKKKKPAVTVFKSRVNEDIIVEEDTTDPPHQHESIVSRW